MSLEWNLKTKKIKRCAKCRLYKAVRHFTKRSSKEGGVQYICRECKNKWRRRHRDNNEERKRHATEMRLYNSTPEGKLKLKIRNQRAYLKRKKAKLNSVLYNTQL